MKLIAFTGLRRSGKDIAAQALVNAGWHQVKFADGLKTMLHAYLQYIGIDAATAIRMIEGDLKEQPAFSFLGRSTRYAMQTLGTEWGRNLIHPDLWVEAAITHAGRINNKVVISDCRFSNEAAAIRQSGGKIVRIVRDGLSIDSHPSETEIESLNYDYMIFNNGTIAQLHEAVLQYADQI